jgi:hypothetical protein
MTIYTLFTYGICHQQCKQRTQTQRLNIRMGPPRRTRVEKKTTETNQNDTIKEHRIQWGYDGHTYYICMYIYWDMK